MFRMPIFTRPIETCRGKTKELEKRTIYLIGKYSGFNFVLKITNKLADYIFDSATFCNENDCLYCFYFIYFVYHSFFYNNDL